MTKPNPDRNINEIDADAAFIVRACNSHDALVFELSRARDMLKSRGIEVTSISAALALAKGDCRTGQRVIRGDKEQ